MAATPLQVMRKQLGYSADEVMKMILRRAGALGTPVMSPASLKTKLSRWENGHEAVGEPYRRLFRDVYGRTNLELGFRPDPDDGDDADLRSRLEVAHAVDAETVELFRSQVDDARRVDRRFGGVTLLDQLRSNMSQVEGLLTYSSGHGQREALTAVLADAAALAGWQALDRNALGQAWGHHERAKAAAREAASVPLLVHATARQAFILIDLGKTAMAVEQLAYARSMGEQVVPPMLRS